MFSEGCVRTSFASFRCDLFCPVVSTTSQITFYQHTKKKTQQNDTVVAEEVHGSEERPEVGQEREEDQEAELQELLDLRAQADDEDLRGEGVDEGGKEELCCDHVAWDGDCELVCGGPV